MVPNFSHFPITLKVWMKHGFGELGSKDTMTLQMTLICTNYKQRKKTLNMYTHTYIEISKSEGKINYFMMQAQKKAVSLA